MSKRHHHQSGDSDRDRERHSEGSEREPEHDKGNAAHIEIEERRFRGGLTPTPELYSRAREQWNQLRGSVTRSPMDPVGNKRSVDAEAMPAGADEDEKEGTR
jgi:hypothetical protein